MVLNINRRHIGVFCMVLNINRRHIGVWYLQIFSVYLRPGELPMNEGDAAQADWRRTLPAGQIPASESKLALIARTRRTVQELGQAPTKRDTAAAAVSIAAAAVAIAAAAVAEIVPATGAHLLQIVQVGSGPGVH